MPSSIHSISLHDALPIYHTIIGRPEDGESRPLERCSNVAGSCIIRNNQITDAQKRYRFGECCLARKYLRLVAHCSDSRLCNIRSEEHTSELQSLRHLVCRRPFTLFPYTTRFRSIILSSVGPKMVRVGLSSAAAM